MFTLPKSRRKSRQGSWRRFGLLGLWRQSKKSGTHYKSYYIELSKLISSAQNTMVNHFQPPSLGAGGPRFKSARPDQTHLASFLLVNEGSFHSKVILWNSGRREFSFAKSFSFREFAT